MCSGVRSASRKPPQAVISKGLLRHLVAIAVGHKGEIDAGPPDRLTIGIAY